MKLGRLAVALTALALLYTLWGSYSLAMGNSRDFQAYYHAAENLRHGQNPYLDSDLPPFVYPPYTVALFAPLTALPVENAIQLWFWLKTGAFLLLAGMLTVAWCKTNTERAILLFLFAFGYHHALKVDFQYGNITVIEQLVLWLGVVLLIRQRAAAHVVAAGLTALVKTTNALLIPLAAAVKRSWTSVWLSAAGLVGVVLAHVWARRAEPDLYPSFQAAVEKLGKSDYLDYTVFTWLRMNLRPAGTPYLETTPTVMALFGIFAVAVGLVGFYSIRRTQDPRLAVAIYLSGFALLAPRFKEYQHLLLIPVAAVVIGSGIKPLWAKAFFVALLCLELFGLDLVVYNLLLFGLACAAAWEASTQTQPAVVQSST